MGNVGRNAEYIEAGRHSYLNQHNSGDEWLTGFAGDATRSIYGQLLRPNFSVKCVIYGHPYYLASCPVRDTLLPPPPSTLPRRVPRYYISENYFELGNPSEKNSSTRGVRVGAVINALLTADSKPVRKI